LAIRLTASILQSTDVKSELREAPAARGLSGAPVPQPIDTTSGLSEVPAARGLSAYNGRRDRTADADYCQARGPDPVHSEPQAIVATTSNPHLNSKCISAEPVFSKSVV
jgi:hypothetical protein